MGLGRQLRLKRRRDIYRAVALLLGIVVVAGLPVLVFRLKSPGLSFSPSPTETPKPTETRTVTEAPTSRPTPAPTATPQATATPAPSPTPPPVVEVKEGVNVRTGPGTNYQKMSHLGPDARAPLVGRHDEWWQIRYERDLAWVYGPLVIALHAEGVPEVPAPPAPTPAGADAGSQAPAATVAAPSLVSPRPGRCFSRSPWLRWEGRGPFHVVVRHHSGYVLDGLTPGHDWPLPPFPAEKWGAWEWYVVAGAAERRSETWHFYFDPLGCDRDGGRDGEGPVGPSPTPGETTPTPTPTEEPPSPTPEKPTPPATPTEKPPAPTPTEAG